MRILFALSGLFFSECKGKANGRIAKIFSANLPFYSVNRLVAQLQSG